MKHYPESPVRTRNGGEQLLCRGIGAEMFCVEDNVRGWIDMKCMTHRPWINLNRILGYGRSGAFAPFDNSFPYPLTHRPETSQKSSSNITFSPDFERPWHTTSATMK